MCSLDPVRTRCWLAVGVCLVLFTASGCGDSETTGTVSGTVSLGGSPLPAGDVIFQEVVSGNGATATVKDGAFEIETPVETGDYKVFVQPPAAPPPAAASAASPAATVEIPNRYLLASGSSPLTATVVEGENKFDFELER